MRLKAATRIDRDQSRSHSRLSAPSISIVIFSGRLSALIKSQSSGGSPARRAIRLRKTDGFAVSQTPSERKAQSLRAPARIVASFLVDKRRVERLGVDGRHKTKRDFRPKQRQRPSDNVYPAWKPIGVDPDQSAPAADPVLPTVKRCVGAGASRAARRRALLDRRRITHGGDEQRTGRDSERAPRSH